MRVKLDLIGVNELSRKLGKIAKTGAETSRRLLNRGAITVANSVRSRTPVQGPTRRQRTRIHLKSAITIEHREYKKGNVIVEMIGPPARQQPHQWIVEEGTKRRVTNNKRVRVAKRVVGFTERVYYRKQKDGTRKKTTYIKNLYQSEYRDMPKRKNRPQLNRGKMPAFHMFRDGTQAVNTKVHADIVDGLRQALEAAGSGK